MSSIADRKRRKQESAILRQARRDLLAELDQLKDEVCDKCKRPVSGAQYTCDCPAAKRIREIGQELSVLLNERTKIKTNPKEVRKVNAKNKYPEITEEAVNAMRNTGMTYSAIAREFGVSAPTLANRRQNWELEKVRAKHQEGKNVEKPSEKKSVVEADADDPTLLGTSEAKIKELKDAVRLKESIIQEQQDVIDKLKAERKELAKQSESSGSWQDEIRDERKLLAILLAREAERMKKLVEVG